MATKRLTLEEAKEALKHPLHEFVWALNYDSNGIPGDWVAMTDMVEPDDLDEQYAPFVSTADEGEAIDATVLTLAEQITYEADRVENAEDLEINKADAEAHLVYLTKVREAVSLAEAFGFTVLAPQDLEWGVCPGATGLGGPAEPTPHIVSLSLCSGCLEYDPQ